MPVSNVYSPKTFQIHFHATTSFLNVKYIEYISIVALNADGTKVINNGNINNRFQNSVFNTEIKRFTEKQHSYW